MVARTPGFTIINADYLANLLGLGRDASMHDETFVSMALAELDLAKSLLRDAHTRLVIDPGRKDRLTDGG